MKEVSSEVMDKPCVPSIISIFDRLENRRQKHKIKHPMSKLIVIALFSIMGGYDDCASFSYYCAEQKDFFAEILDMSKGVPSHDTFSAVLSTIKPDQFNQLFAEFINLFCEGISQIDAIAIDGKELRACFDKASSQSMVGMVSAFAHGCHMTLGCLPGGKGGNEAVVLRDLIKILDIKGKIITADALHCKKVSADAILEEGGDYCLALKDNQKNLKEDILTFVNDKETKPYDEYKDIDKNHGRIETREIKIYDNVDFLNQTHEFPGLKAFAVVNATREFTHKNERKTTKEIRYYVISKHLDAQSALKIIRGHWCIENSLHWVLDNNLKEDKHNAKKSNLGINVAAMRRFAINLLKLDKSKHSMRIKMMKSSINPKKYIKLFSSDAT